EVEGLQEEIKRNREELEGAWEHLRGEQRRLEEFQSEVKQGAVLDEEQARVISDLLEKLSNNIAQPSNAREYLDNAFEMVESQQAILNPHWEQLEKQKAEANEQQAEVERLSGELQEANSSFEEAENLLHEQIAELKFNTATLESKQDLMQMLQEQLEERQKLQEQVNLCNNQTSSSSGEEDLTLDFDAEALKSMSTEELLKTIEDLQEKLKVDSSFVEEQEQELNYKQQTIDELQEKIHSASDEERSAIEEELTDEKDSYQMLTETLVGQRRSLVERQESLEIHQTVLSKRKKQASGQSQVDLGPIVDQIEQERQKYSQQVEKLEAEIELLSDGIVQAQETITAKTEERDTKCQALQAMQENLSALQTANTQLWARVNLYEEALGPIQDSLESLRHKLQAISDSLTQIQETGDYQQQAITDMRSSIENLISQ
ncbi:MAG: pilus motility taxis protein HmpF, partial [Cyanobacteria bacterium P01_D01_bin.116]